MTCDFRSFSCAHSRALIEQQYSQLARLPVIRVPSRPRRHDHAPLDRRPCMSTPLSSRHTLTRSFRGHLPRQSQNRYVQSLPASQHLPPRPQDILRTLAPQARIRRPTSHTARRATSFRPIYPARHDSALRIRTRFRQRTKLRLRLATCSPPARCLVKPYPSPLDLPSCLVARWAAALVLKFRRE